MTTPSVTIGVPVYNGADSLEAVCEALLGQTFTDFELVISDNASTDGTEAICRRYAERDARVRYLRQPRNLGPVANFELLLAGASTPFFMWAAADDRWEPEFLATSLAALHSQPTAVSCISRVHMPTLPDAGTTPLRGSLRAKVRRLIKEQAANSRYYGVWRTEILRAAVHEGSGAFIAADWSIIIAACKRGDFAVTDEVLMTRGGRGASTSWRRQMALLGSRGVGRVFPFLPFTAWLVRNLPLWTFLGCLDLVLLRNLSITVHYALEVLKQPRDPYRTHAPALPPATK